MDDLGGLFQLFFGIAATSAGVWVVYVNYQKIQLLLKNKLAKSLDRYGDAEMQPFRKIFYEYNHRSAELWYEWIRGQDKAIQDMAFDKLLEYLNSPLEELGSVTTDVINTVLSFKREKSFSAITDLLKKSRKAWGQYKTIEVFYEKAIIGLTTMDQDDAEKFILAEYEIAKHKNDMNSLVVSLMKALGELKASEKIEETLVELLTENLIKFDIKKYALSMIEKYELETQKRINFRVFKKYVTSSAKTLEENDDKVLEAILTKLKKYISVDFDEEVWVCIINASQVERLKSIIYKFLSDFIQFEDQIDPMQFSELLKQEDPGLTKYIEAMSKRNKLNDKEQDLLKSNLKKEYLEFETKTLNIEKSKKTMSIPAELNGEYHALEQIFFNGSEIKNDKNTGTIHVISGNAEEEKLFLLRALAANNNIAFAYIDSHQVLSSSDVMMTLGNTLNNSKPCIVYFDNLDTTLSKPLNKIQASNQKEINNIVKELGIIPNMFFIGNISYNKENIKTTNPNLHKNINGSSHGDFKIFHEIRKPDMKDRRRVFQNYQQKLQDKRILDSEGFSVDALLGATEGFSYIDFQIFLDEYMQISLLMHGCLVSMPEFLKYAYRSAKLFDAFTKFESDDSDAELEDLSDQNTEAAETMS